MQFILVSDIHATSQNPTNRKDDILNTFISKFSFILKYAQKNNASILQAGDFFHKPRDWNSLDAIISLFNQYKGVNIYSIFGQHDTYMRSKTLPNNLLTLNKAGYLTLLNKQPVRLNEHYRRKEIYLYGCSWGEEVPKPKGEVNILVVHKSISKKAIFPGHDYTSPEYFIKKNKGWDLILVGDIHRYFTVRTKKTILVNTGPLLRLEASQYNRKHKPTFLIYDTNKKAIVDKIIIPHEPYISVLNRIDKSLNKQTEKILKELANKIQEKFDNSKSNKIKNNSFSFLDNLQSFVHKNKNENHETIKLLNLFINGERNETGKVKGNCRPS